VCESFIIVKCGEVLELLVNMCQNWSRRVIVIWNVSCLLWSSKKRRFSRFSTILISTFDTFEDDLNLFIIYLLFIFINVFLFYIGTRGIVFWAYDRSESSYIKSRITRWRNSLMSRPLWYSGYIWRYFFYGLICERLASNVFLREFE